MSQPPQNPGEELAAIFPLVFVTIALIPLTFLLLGRLLRRQFDTGTAVQVVMAALLWGAFFSLLGHAGSEAQQNFDPYETLDLGSGASKPEIKRAYFKKSKLYHPDKNPGDKLAEARFMKVAKAYEALTDPVAMENYRLYGHPDGRQPMLLGIALPKFMFGGSADSDGWLLLGYAAGTLVLVPGAMWMLARLMARGEHKGPKIAKETLEMLASGLNETSTLNQILALLCDATEFKYFDDPLDDTAVSDRDDQALVNQLTERVRDAMVANAKETGDDTKRAAKGPQSRAELLLLLHLLIGIDDGLLSKRLEVQFAVMMATLGDMLDFLVEFALGSYWPPTAQRVVQLTQMIAQGQWLLPEWELTDTKRFEQAKAKQAKRAADAAKVVPSVKIKVETIAVIEDGRALPDVCCNDFLTCKLSFTPTTSRGQGDGSVIDDLPSSSLTGTADQHNRWWLLVSREWAGMPKAERRWMHTVRIKADDGSAYPPPSFAVKFRAQAVPADGVKFSFKLLNRNYFAVDQTTSYKEFDVKEQEDDAGDGNDDDGSGSEGETVGSGDSDFVMDDETGDFEFVPLGGD